MRFGIEPQLARGASALPVGPEWCYEQKYDGFRAIAFVDGEKLVLQSRGAKDLTRYFPELALPPGSYVLDGEIVIDGDGPGEAFGALQQRIHPAASRIERLARELPASFVAFDLLELDGQELLEQPFERRREGARTARRRAAFRARPRSGRGAALARADRGSRREAPRRRLRPRQAHGDGQGQAAAHDRLRCRRLPAGCRPRHRRLADPRALPSPTGSCSRSVTAQRSRPSASASCPASSPPTRPVSGGAASRAAGARSATSNGWRCARSWSSRSATTTSATGGSATARRSSAGAMTSRRAECTIDQLR